MAELYVTPVGPVSVETDPDGALTALAFAGEGAGVKAALPAWLAAYFEGDIAALDDVRVVSEGTPFQQRVWNALRRIPPGVTASYTEVAAAIGMPTAVRAVARANATNHVAIVVPCHRVIRSDGSLGGYGGGLHRKRWLLEHEASRISTRPA